MKLSKKSEYACLALVDITQNAQVKPNQLAKMDGIAKRKNIPKKFLEQILLSLKGAGYVKSKRGVGGGYKLAKSPSEINLAEVIRLFDGALAPVESASEHFYEKTPIEKNEKLLSIFKEIRDYAADILENTTLADLVEK
ncbi:BadM/Rrf2 family transcriptional regulator [Halanaerobium sp. DL-01]|uniref:RrF2 family transcriptional regulator n=1 Tax=Halanaerobium sp. DL-01 TaxID=1653064 RepID=UPI000DF17957|nr:Rrf2 family transcriptional regulator [Halanaerobium sp. DL-01]RCW86900.1 BadM/Rrf2 family transcriptional regulator [Halanaerobium sp. DL-01]